MGGAASGAAALRRMKATPTGDAAFGRGRIRADGRKVHDNYVFRVKPPGASKKPWDCCSLVRTVPGDAAFRPMDQDGCPLLAQLTKG